MIDNKTTDFKVVRLDDLPVLFGILEKLQVDQIFDSLIPSHPNWAGEISFGQVINGWLVYIISTSDHRLYQVEKWVGQHIDVYKACLKQPVRALDFSDDRLADLLDKLSEPKIWSEFEVRLNQQIVRVYDLPVERVRLDPTTISTYVEVNPDGLLQLGHSKDRRPEDAQLKIQLATLDPLGLPLMTQVVGGQSADDPLYVPAIRQIQKSIGAGGKTYIGDVKMAAHETRAMLVTSGDYYLCPLSERQLPNQQRESLITQALSGEVEKLPILRQRLDPLGIKSPVDEELAVGYETSVPMQAEHNQRTVQWKERRLVIRSNAYSESQAEQLDKRLKQADEELYGLVVRKQGKRRLDAEQTREATAQIIARYHLEGLLTAAVTSTETEYEVRNYKNRPAQKRTQAEISISVQRDEAAINAVKERMGWRVYATNHPDLTLNEAILAYRDQYQIERSFSRLKGRPLGMSPMYMTNERRMIGLIHLLTIALRILTLVEFTARRQLKNEGSTLTGVYPGQKGRQTASPSATLLLEAFRGVDAVIGNVNNVPVLYLRPLTDTQLRILSLLELDIQLYDKLLTKFQNLAPE